MGGFLEEEKKTVGRNPCDEQQYDHGKFRIVAHVADWVAGELRPRVHDRVEWVKTRDLGEYELLPADGPIAAVVQSLED